jgi:hypothetical protein
MKRNCNLASRKCSDPNQPNTSISGYAKVFGYVRERSGEYNDQREITGLPRKEMAHHYPLLLA